MKYLDDGRFMVPVASSAVTQEEWDQIFGPATKEWDHRGRWQCLVCDQEFDIWKKGVMATHCNHTFVKCLWRSEAAKTEEATETRLLTAARDAWEEAPPPERTRIDSKPRKSPEAPGLPPENKIFRAARLGAELYDLWNRTGPCPCCGGSSHDL